MPLETESAKPPPNGQPLDNQPPDYVAINPLSVNETQPSKRPYVATVEHSLSVPQSLLENLILKKTGYFTENGREDA